LLDCTSFCIGHLLHHVSASARDMNNHRLLHMTSSTSCVGKLSARDMNNHRDPKFSSTVLKITGRHEEGFPSLQSAGHGLSIFHATIYSFTRLYNTLLGSFERLFLFLILDIHEHTSYSAQQTLSGGGGVYPPSCVWIQLSSFYSSLSSALSALSVVSAVSCGAR
jgi:hypothetical protein